MAHLVFSGGFIKTTLLSAKFIPVDERCGICLAASCGYYWFHLKTKRVVCRRCMGDVWVHGDGISRSLKVAA